MFGRKKMICANCQRLLTSSETLRPFEGREMCPNCVTQLTLARRKLESAIEVSLYKTTADGAEVEVTNKRISCRRKKFIRAQTTEIPIGKVEGVQIVKGLFSTSVIISASGGSTLELTKVRDAEKLREAVMDAIQR